MLTKPTKPFPGLERQTGVQGLSWHRQLGCWCVSFRKADEAGERRRISVPISKHLKEGLSEDEAVAAALAEAKAHRAELVRQGKLKPPKLVTAKATGSTVRGAKYQAVLTKQEQGCAMKGLETFEAFGTVPEEAPGASAEGQVVTRSFCGLERPSGVQAISWNRAWQLSWKEAGKTYKVSFPISKHIKQGLSEDEAVAAALAEAKAHRAELVRQGKLKPPKPITAQAAGEGEGAG